MVSRHYPLDVRCAECGAYPGQRCAVIDRVTGLPTDRRRTHPHPVRRQAAADANRAGKS
jgi:hypothetical protein